MSIPSLKDAKNLTGKRVLLRLDLNIPLEGGAPRDDSRIEGILPTISFLKNAGVAEIVIISHHSDAEQSLEPIARFLAQKISNRFIPDMSDEVAFWKVRAEGHSVFVCENLRFSRGEEENDEVFAARLAALGDVYVNEAFSASHRAHASIVRLPALLPSYAGFLFMHEVEELSSAFTPEHPFLMVLGGAKPETKIPLIHAFLPQVDSVFIGGAVANNFFHALNFEIGSSRLDPVSSDLTKILDSGKVILPEDVVVKNDEGVFVKSAEELSPGDMMLDIGPRAGEKLKELARAARFIVWNAPLGDYEKAGFEKASIAFAEAVRESSALSIVGGGDTVALLRTHGLLDAFDFVSSGGGAMLQFLLKKTLPGIEALKNSM